MPRNVGVGASFLQRIEEVSRGTYKGPAIQRDVDQNICVDEHDHR